MKKAELWKTEAKNIICFTSLKPLSFKEEKFKINYPKLLKFLKTVPKKNCYAKQVHGRRVLWADNFRDGEPRQADGFVSGEKKSMLLIFTADCLPVFIYDKAKGHTAIIHCGWKSTYKGIVESAVGKLKKKGSKPGNLKVILGPGIRECCYEVSPSYVRRFAKKHGKTGVYKRKEKQYFSLPDIVKQQLKKMGIPAKNIEDTRECTCCRPGKYYSYRRDGKGTGRMVSGIFAK